MLKQQLQIKLSQKLSPQQIQLMKLIQLPTLDFEQRLQNELEENPALETGKEEVEKTEMIPMEQNQIIYANSGVHNETKDYVIPFIENARRPYRQLSLIEDAIVIYRLVRAPERLVFNVDVGNMAPPKAEAYLRKLIQNYWARKTFDNDQTNVVNKFNPQSMLDAFWFAKRQGSEGTSVEQLAGGANLGELSDLMYFIKKLYRALKVPATRIDPEDRTVDPSSILREELKFAKFVNRLRNKFSQIFDHALKVQLVLNGCKSLYHDLYPMLQKKS